MPIQRVPLAAVNRRMRQIRQLAHTDGLVVLTSHDKPALIVVEVERGRRLLAGAEHLARLLAANNLVDVARAISAADAVGLSHDGDWIKQALADLSSRERAS
jgi:hypothetical protein